MFGELMGKFGVIWWIVFPLILGNSHTVNAVLSN